MTETKKNHRSTHFIPTFYSYLKASIGFRLAALRAGYHPKKIPMAEQTKNDIITEMVVITTGQLMIEAIT